MSRRLVVTGQNAQGKSVIVADTQVEPIQVALLPAAEFYRLWGSDNSPQLPNDGSAPDQSGYFPPPGGYRFGFCVVGPDSTTFPLDLDFDAALTELAVKLPGLSDVTEPRHPGMHATDTVDLELVVSGEIWLELDDGKQVQLECGDCIVQNGTHHAWHNRRDEPAVMLVTLLGAVRS